MMLHLLVPIIYSLLFFRSFPNWPLYAQFVIGVIVGFSFFIFDRLIHVFWVDPDAEFSQVIRQEWQRNKLRALRLLFSQRDLQEKLITRSAMFMGAYVVLTIFVLTSTGSVFGMGLMLGMGLHFVMDFWQYRRSPEAFSRHFLWQVKRHWSIDEINWLVIGFSLFFVFLSALVLF